MKSTRDGYPFELPKSPSQFLGLRFSSVQVRLGLNAVDHRILRSRGGVIDRGDRFLARAYEYLPMRASFIRTSSLGRKYSAADMSELVVASKTVGLTSIILSMIPPSILVLVTRRTGFQRYR